MLMYSFEAESVAARLRENGFRCRTVEISIRDKELYSYTKQTKVSNATNITKEIADAGFRLFCKHFKELGGKVNDGVHKGQYQ